MHMFTFINAPFFAIIPDHHPPIPGPTGPTCPSEPCEAMPCPEVTGDTIQDGTQFKSLWRRLIPGTLVGLGHLGHLAWGWPMMAMVSPWYPWYPHGMGIGLRTLGSLSRWIGESHGTARQCLRSISSGSQAQPGPNPYGEKPLLAFVLICFDYKSEEGKRRGN